MTYGELKTIFANLYEQTSAPATGVDVRNRFINLACSVITRRSKWSWRKKAGVGTTDGTRFLSLPSDIDGIVKDTLLIGGLWTEIQESEKSFISEASTVFYLTGNNRDGHKAYFPCAVPDSGQAVEYWYYMEHPALVLDTDITIIPDGECICNLAVGRFLKSEGESDEALTFLEDAENGIIDMKEAEQRSKATKRTKKRGANYYDIKNCY